MNNNRHSYHSGKSEGFRRALYQDKNLRIKTKHIYYTTVFNIHLYFNIAPEERSIAHTGSILSNYRAPFPDHRNDFQPVSVTQRPCPDGAQASGPAWSDACRVVIGPRGGAGGGVPGSQRMSSYRLRTGPVGRP